MFSEYAGIWKLLYDWQTIITGALAIVAALVAAWPVWRQLKRLKVQSAIMGRDVLAKRVADVESRKNESHAMTQIITNNFLADLYRHDPGGDPNITPAWAHQSELEVARVLATLNSHQEKGLDAGSIDRKRAIVIQDARALCECLSDIHSPHSVDLDDPDLGLSKDEIAAVAQQGALAETRLMDRISALREGAEEPDKAFRAGVDPVKPDTRRVAICF
jgi:hypothetical protein